MLAGYSLITEQDARDVIEKHSEKMQVFLRLHDWTICFQAEPECETGTTCGHSGLLPDNLEAKVTLYYHKLEDIPHAVETLMHELVHCKLSEFDRSHAVMDLMLSEDRKDIAVEVFTQACERTTTSLTKMLVPLYLGVS